MSGVDITPTEAEFERIVNEVRGKPNKREAVRIEMQKLAEARKKLAS